MERPPDIEDFDEYLELHDIRPGEEPAVLAACYTSRSAGTARRRRLTGGRSDPNQSPSAGKTAAAYSYFTDAELSSALIVLANEQARDEPAAAQIAEHLLHARSGHDIDVVFGRLRLKVDKPRLAELLWPTLLTKFEAELSTGNVTTPVIQLVLDVQDLTALNSGAGYALSPPDDPNVSSSVSSISSPTNDMSSG